MILIGLLGLSVILAVLALRTAPRGDGAKLHLAISSVPLLLTVVVPVPFALAVRGPTDWARQALVAVTRVGITLKFHPVRHRRCAYAARGLGR